MKLAYKTLNGRMVFEINGSNPKELWREIAVIQETFEAELCCGVCQDPNIRYVVRRSHDAKGKQFEYFELRCTKPGCRARFSFGQAQDTANLFPKRKAEDGSYLPNNGWAKWQKPGAQAQSAPQPEDENQWQGVSDDDVPF